MSEQEWLQSLKAGDQVCYRVMGYGSHASRVVKVTNTQIILNSYRFRRDNGRQIGGERFHTAYLEKPTPELMARIREQLVRNEIEHVRWCSVSAEVIEQVLKLVRAQSHPTVTP